MGLMEQVVEFIKETVLPELAALREADGRIQDRLTALEQRMGDTNAHLVDQSRRIDQLREELGGRIEQVREELGGRIGSLEGRIEHVREELGGRIETIHGRLDATNRRLDQLYEVVVRREEHYELAAKVGRLEQEVAEIKRHLAA